jgi:hypothetical protein
MGSVSITTDVPSVNMMRSTLSPNDSSIEATVLPMIFVIGILLEKNDFVFKLVFTIGF